MSASLALAVWPFAVTVATLVSVPVGFPLSCALTVKVTMLPFAIDGIVIPAPCIAATVTLPALGQVAVPAVTAQVTLLTDEIAHRGVLEQRGVAVARGERDAGVVGDRDRVGRGVARA